MPQNLEDGPCKERKCTDVLFYLIYVIFLGAMAGCTFYGIKYGKPAMLFAPIDGDGKQTQFSLNVSIGRICGYDSDVLDYKYMYIWDINQAGTDTDFIHIFTSGICVKKCPSQTVAVECINT